MPRFDPIWRLAGLDVDRINFWMSDSGLEGSNSGFGNSNRMVSDSGLEGSNPGFGNLNRMVSDSGECPTLRIWQVLAGLSDREKGRPTGYWTLTPRVFCSQETEN